MFKFDDFPAIKEARKEYKRLNSRKYSLDVKEERSFNTIGYERAKKLYETARDEFTKYELSVYAKIIFDTFSQIKPSIYNIHTNEKFKWSDMFADNFQAMTEGQRGKLVSIIEEQVAFIFPPEYYDNRDEREERNAKIWEKHYKKLIFNHFKKERGIILHGDQQEEIYNWGLKRKEQGIQCWLDLKEYERLFPEKL